MSQVSIKNVRVENAFVHSPACFVWSQTRFVYSQARFVYPQASFVYSWLDLCILRLAYRTVSHRPPIRVSVIVSKKLTL